MHRVKIHNTAYAFMVQEGESILQAALRQGVKLPFGCAGGVCGVCMSHVLRGKVYYPAPPLALFEEDEAVGKCLYCVGRIRGDVELLVPELS